MTLVADKSPPTTRMKGSRFVHFGKMAGISMRLFQAQPRALCLGTFERLPTRAVVVSQPPRAVNFFFRARLFSSADQPRPHHSPSSESRAHFAEERLGILLPIQ